MVGGLEGEPGLLLFHSQFELLVEWVILLFARILSLQNQFLPVDVLLDILVEFVEEGHAALQAKHPCGVCYAVILC